MGFLQADNICLEGTKVVEGIDISHFDHYTVAIELSATACLLTLE
jgi:hypothetical protein